MFAKNPLVAAGCWVVCVLPRLPNNPLGRAACCVVEPTLPKRPLPAVVEAAGVAEAWVEAEGVVDVPKFPKRLEVPNSDDILVAVHG